MGIIIAARLPYFDNVAQALLTDIRDSKTYVIRKLADGNCWMVKNLDLDLSTSVALTNQNTDLNSKASWTPQNSTQTTTGTVWAEDGGDTARSMDPGNIYFPGGAGTGAADTNGNLAGATSGEPWEFVGNYYNWYAATAGTGLASAVNSDSGSGNATDSICPKGWWLPFALRARSLLAIYNIVTNDAIGADAMLKSPLNFVRAGFYSYSRGAVVHQGTRGFWWIPVPGSNATTAYSIVSVNDEIQSAGVGPNAKGHGFFIRCIAR